MFIIDNRAIRAIAIGGLVVVMAGCTVGYHAGSPEVLYSDKSSEAIKLQIPPDLTDVSDGEQFVLPGNASGPIARNTLLPNLDSVSFQRNGAQSWLEIASTPEALWPRLLAFVRRDQLKIAQTEPVNGIIVTSWQSTDKESEGSVLKKLVGGSDMYQRIAFRMERSATGTTRLFARRQQAESELARATGADQAQWPVATHDAEQTSLLLQRLLVFLGIEEQRAKGLLNDQSAAAILDDATLKTTAAGTQLLVHHGYNQSFALLASAITASGMVIENQDKGIGEIRVSAASSDSTSELNRMTFRVSPVHVSAANVSLLGADGRPLESVREKNILTDLRDRLS